MPNVIHQLISDLWNLWQVQTPPRPTSTSVHDAPLCYHYDSDVAKREEGVFQEDHNKQPIFFVQEAF